MAACARTGRHRPARRKWLLPKTAAVTAVDKWPARARPSAVARTSHLLTAPTPPHRIRPPKAGIPSGERLWGSGLPGHPRLGVSRIPASRKSSAHIGRVQFIGGDGPPGLRRATVWVTRKGSAARADVHPYSDGVFDTTRRHPTFRGLNFTDVDVGLRWKNQADACCTIKVLRSYPLDSRERTSRSP